MQSRLTSMIRYAAFEVGVGPPRPTVVPRLTSPRDLAQLRVPRRPRHPEPSAMILTKPLLGLAVALALALPVHAQTAAPAAAPAMKPSSTMMKAKAAPLDINSASEDELKAIKGVGDVRAKAIIAGRPYKGKDDLVQKKVLPQKVYDGIKDKIIAKQK